MDSDVGSENHATAFGAVSEAGPLPPDQAKAASITAIEGMLNAHFADWSQLLRAAESRVEARTLPLAVVPWAETDALRSAQGLQRGETCDLWIGGGLCIYQHPGSLDRLLGWFFALVSRLLAPVLRLREHLDALFVRLASRLGFLFAIISIPAALIGFMADLFGLFVGFLRALPALALSPLSLVKEILALPFRLAAALLSRLIRTLVLSWVGGWLEDQKRIPDLLRRYPWLRGMILGFFRNDRPDYPVIIPTAGVSQVLSVKRRGVTGAKEYLIVVEGDPIEKGFGPWLRMKIKQLVLPFYWERTVHMFCCPRNAGAAEAISEALGQRAVEWS